jgi:hypothetical protein
MVLAHFHPLIRDLPNCGRPIDLSPVRAHHLVRPADSKDQELQRLGRGAPGTGQTGHELRRFAVGGRWMVTRLSFRPFGGRSFDARQGRPKQGTLHTKLRFKATSAVALHPDDRRLCDLLKLAR